MVCYLRKVIVASVEHPDDPIIAPGRMLQMACHLLLIVIQTSHTVKALSSSATSVIGQGKRTQELTILTDRHKLTPVFAVSCLAQPSKRRNEASSLNLISE